MSSDVATSLKMFLFYHRNPLAMNNIGVIGHFLIYFPALSFRPALGGLLSSSYRQHQESLAAERERRRVEREERLQRIEREERNKHR